MADNRRRLVKYEIAKGNAIEAWLHITIPGPAEDSADVVTERNRFVRAQHDRQRVELGQAWVGPHHGLQATIDAVVDGAAIQAVSNAARVSVWSRLE